VNCWVVYSTCSIFALCSPAALASGLQAEDASVPAAAVEVGPAALGGPPEPPPPVA
jgi:hypothetical protein